VCGGGRARSLEGPAPDGYAVDLSSLV
jgi:hypothetical protein